MADYVGHLANKTLTIVTLEELPFVILKDPKDLTDVQSHEIEGDILKTQKLT